MNERPEGQTHEPNPPYAAFLVRCWREGEQWRIVLENVATRERLAFDSVEVFLEALQATLVGVPPSGN